MHLGIFCDCTAWFVSDLVGNHEDRFSQQGLIHACLFFSATWYRFMKISPTMSSCSYMLNVEHLQAIKIFSKSDILLEEKKCKHQTPVCQLWLTDILPLKQTLILEAPPTILNSDRVSPRYISKNPKYHARVGSVPRRCTVLFPVPNYICSFHLTTMKRFDHGVQRRMISMDIFFSYFWDYYFLLFCCYMWPSARCGNYISPFLFATSIWKSFLKYEWCPWNCKLQFHGHHSYFRKDLQMLLTLKEGHM